MENAFDKKISIIIPIYNCEQYLERCLDSVIAQIYTNFEVICVDDGSTDKSGIISDLYADKDERFHVIHIPNGGVSHARNIGLERATGEYILFLDADDWIESEHIYKMLPVENEDFVYCGYKNFINDHIESIHTPLNKVFALESLKKCLTPDMVSFVWCGCYRNSLLQSFTLKFDENVNIGEDILFNFAYLEHCTKIRFTDSTSYIHYCVKQSLVHHYYPERLDKEERECRYFEMFTKRKDLRQRWYFWHIALNHFIKWKKCGDKEISRDCTKRLSQALKNSYFRESIPYIRKEGSLDEKVETYFMHKLLYPLYKPFYSAIVKMSQVKYYFGKRENNGSN